MNEPTVTAKTSLFSLMTLLALTVHCFSGMKTTTNASTVLHFALYVDGSGFTALIVVEGKRFAVNMADARQGVVVEAVQNKRQSLCATRRTLNAAHAWGLERVEELSTIYRAKNEALYAA